MSPIQAHCLLNTFALTSSACRGFHPNTPTQARITARCWSIDQRLGIGTDLLCIPSRYDVAQISGNYSTCTLITAARWVLRVGAIRGSAVPALGLSQQGSSTEWLPNTDTGFAWVPLQYTLMTCSGRDLNLVSPSFRSLHSPLTLKGN